jgi:two-component system response regulator (stage 0 sporulation protein A)
MKALQIKPKEDMVHRVTELLHQMGIPAHVKGYIYLRYAIIFSVDEPVLLDSLKHGLYTEVAKRYETTPRKVEQCIGTALDFTQIHEDNADTVREYFGENAVRNKYFHLSNAVFIKTVAVKLIEEREEQDNSIWKR